MQNCSDFSVLLMRKSDKIFHIKKRTGSALQETGNPLKKYDEACNISKGKVISNS